MPSGGFSNRIRARSRRGARLEPRHGWSLGVKTSRAPDGAGSPDPEETPDERSARVADEERRRGRASDAMDRKDRADLGIGADDDVPGMPLVRRRRGGMEPRTAHHGDPVEDRRASYSPSTSVWAQDPRAEHLREEARDTEWDRRMGFEGEAAVRSLRSAVVDGAQALVSLRWGPAHRSLDPQRCRGRVPAVEAAARRRRLSSPSRRGRQAPRRASRRCPAARTVAGARRLRPCTGCSRGRALRSRRSRASGLQPCHGPRSRRPDGDPGRRGRHRPSRR